MVKRVLSTLVCTIFFLSFSNAAYADPLTNGSDNSSVTSEQERIEELEDNISRLDNDIIEYMEQMKHLEEEIAVSQEKVNQKEAELKEAQDKVITAREIFAKRMRSLYENDYEKSYIIVLLSSESFSDFINRITTLKSIIEYDNKIITQLKQKESEIDLQRNLLIEENNRLHENKNSLDEKIRALNALKDKQTTLIENLKSKPSTRSTASFKLPSRGGSYSFGNEVISFAGRFLGTPYRWGGDSPEEGFDCSGFTQYVFGNFGIGLNRTASSQTMQGTPVAYSDLQLGDLVFYGSPAYHVGIYVGEGQFIHAPHRGEVVKVAPIITRYFSTARRLQP